MTGFAKIHIILKDCEDIQVVCPYIYISDIFARINESLILRNKTENDILKLIINFKEVK